MYADKRMCGSSHKNILDQDNVSAKFAEHSTYAQQKLQELDNRILNKTQAVKALKSSQKPDPKVRKVVVFVMGNSFFFVKWSAEWHLFE